MLFFARIDMLRALLTWLCVAFCVTSCSKPSQPKSAAVPKNPLPAAVAGSAAAPEPGADFASSPDSDAPQASQEASADGGTEVDSDSIVPIEPQPAKSTPAPAPTTSTVDAPHAIAAPNPEPTEEQLASWARTPFLPLDLLACRDGSSLGFVAAAAQTPDGSHFILGGEQVTLWTATGEEPEYVFLDLRQDNQTRSITALAVAPNGKWFATGDSEGLVQIWSLSGRQEVASEQLEQNDITQIAISTDGQEMATTSYGNEIAIWDPATLSRKSRFSVDTNSLKRIEYLSPGKLVAAGESTRLWDTASGKSLQPLLPGRYQFAMARSPDGTQFVYGTANGLQLCQTVDAKPGQLLAAELHGEPLIAFSPDQKFLAIGSGREILIRDIATGQYVQVIDAAGPGIAGLNWLPGSNLLVIVTAWGRVRVWGDRAAAERFGMSPMHEIPSVASMDAVSSANALQLLNIVDVRSLPRLPDGGTSVGNATTASYTTASSEQEAQQFYQHLLGKSGWEQLPGNSANPNYLFFRKYGLTLFISLYRSDEKTNVSLTTLGNLDLRTLPKFDAGPIEITHESDATVHYQTTANLLQIEVNLLRRLHAQGWTAFSRLHSSHSEELDIRDMEFVKGCTILRVSARKFPATPDRFTIQYSNYLTMNALPIPSDSGFVEFDSSVEPYLVATTKLNLSQTREFYERELVAQGWLPRSQGRSLQEDACWLAYISGQKDLTVGLTKLANGRTRIRVGENLENASWQLSKPKELPRQPAGSAEPKTGIEAADFPLLAGSGPADFDLERPQIEFEIADTTLLDVAAKYLEKMELLGWKPTREGIREETYVFLTFGKDGVEIDLRAHIRDRLATVSVQGDGVLWTKPLPVTRRVTSYESWLRTNRHPATLELLDTYEAEMQEISAGQ